MSHFLTRFCPETAQRLAELGARIADGEGYADVLDELLHGELCAGRWDGNRIAEDRLQLALADTAEAAVNAVRRQYAAEAA